MLIFLWLYDGVFILRRLVFPCTELGSIKQCVKQSRQVTKLSIVGSMFTRYT